MFKVVPDQLRISDGWVRCGQCDEVFDANVHLQTRVAAAEAPAPKLLLRTPSDDGHTQDADPEADDGRVQRSSDLLADAQTPEPEPERLEKTAASETGADRAGTADQTDVPSRFADHLIAVEPARGPTEPALDEGHAAPLEDDLPVAPEETPDHLSVERPRSAGPDQPSFMVNRSRLSPWTRPWVRAGLLLLCLVLFLALLLQVLVQERERIAATEPGLKPMLQSVCAVLGCQISPLRQIDSVVIDSSSFSKVRADVYRLSFSLKNTAPIDVATPAVELTLTDSQEQIVVRRVLFASDFATPSQLLVAKGELTVSLPLRIQGGPAVEHISGYRLLAFYP